jgi:glycosidase
VVGVTVQGGINRKGRARVLGSWTRSKIGLGWLALVCLGLAMALPASAQAPARHWGDEVLYFVLVDRFADGDPANNRGVQARNPGGWHGGDLKGLTQQLAELQDLGVTAIWINPVQLQQARGMPANSAVGEFTHEGFHGYWMADFEKIDPHFGTEADLKALVDAAHQRGIKVLLDVVYNHTGYTSIYADRRTATGEKWVRLGEGNCEVDPVTCAVGGLPDLRTELPEVREHVLAANIGLAKRSGVDGLRLDTYKHLSSEFWAEHRKRTRAEIGRDFFLLAEYWGGTAQGLDAFFERDEVDSGFDFSFKGSCEGWVQGRGRSVAYGAYLRSRHQVRKGYVLAHYLSSHDEPMALGNLKGDKAAFKVCAALQMASLGMPVIYYGEEVARGGHDWPLNRNDMPWGERDVKPGKGIARDEAMRAFYKQLIALRKERAALRRGDYQLLMQPADAVLAFGRKDSASGDHVIVLANRDDQPRDADIAAPAGWPASARDLLTGETVATADGRLKATLPPKSVRILAPKP